MEKIKVFVGCWGECYTEREREREKGGWTQYGALDSEDEWQEI